MRKITDRFEGELGESLVSMPEREALCDATDKPSSKQALRTLGKQARKACENPDCTLSAREDLGSKVLTTKRVLDPEKNVYVTVPDDSVRTYEITTSCGIPAPDCPNNGANVSALAETIVAITSSARALPEPLVS